MKLTLSCRSAPCTRPMAPMPPEAAIALGRRRLERLWQAGTDILGSPLAHMAGATTWVSEDGLVAARCNAGGCGVLACGAMEPDQRAAEIAGTHALTRRPFGVILIVMHARLDQLIEVCAAQRVTHLVLAGGLLDRA